VDTQATPHTYLVFVWHMHQPFYKDLATSRYQLPWTRLHALKDYFGMAAMLDEFPRIHQTFNLVPSLLVQIEEYAEGRAHDPFLDAALKPAAELDAREREFILDYFFQAHPTRMIGRFPRYKELHERPRHAFGEQEMRDLQVLSQLAWFDEIYLESDPETRALVERGRDYSLEDQALMGRKQREICARVLGTYRRLADAGQIELSVTPFYHPILPLLVDSDIAGVSHPGTPLPRRFAYREDARHQIVTALDYGEAKLGRRARGLWPSEGSSSDATLELASEAGVEWMASDNGVLGATLGRLAGPRETCRPYCWRQNGREMKLIFRDHFLSDLIGFVYARMGTEEAAVHLMERIHEHARPLVEQRLDALVPIILDGENAWEHYAGNGRPFLKELYRRISEDGSMSAVTVSEALAHVPAEPLARVHPGSWINANYDIWIGAEEDNRAWELLLDARECYDRVANSPEGARLDEAARRLAFEELLIAEGSDWCWWYGPEHHSANDAEFDALFRGHLAAAYRALGQAPPEALSRPIAHSARPAIERAPAGPVEAVVDGRLFPQGEWTGAGYYGPPQQIAMHGGQRCLLGVHYGSDGEKLYLRLDLDERKAGEWTGAEIRLTLRTPRGEQHARTRLSAGVARVEGALRVAYGTLCELSARFDGLGILAAEPLGFQLSIWRDGLPVGAAPAEGWIEFTPAEPAEWN
jgi:alpha-amylase/alpha-mannosidase (GH57 family)